MTAILGLMGGITGARARTVHRVRFAVVDPISHRSIPGARVSLQVGSSPPLLLAESSLSASTPTLDLSSLTVSSASEGARLIALDPGQSIILHVERGVPVTDIYIRVTAVRLQIRPNSVSSGAQIGTTQIRTFAPKGSTDIRQITQGQSGVATDSAGQQHIRGEHAEITYVVDGVPLPDTLSGSQQSVVVPSTIQSLEMVTGGFAPEFGGETAAILNIFTLPGARKESSDFTVQAGSYNTVSGDLTSVGPLGPKTSYSFNLSANRTSNALEPQQPDNQTAHNAGADRSIFGKIRFTLSPRDVLALTLSQNGGPLQINNRTGLPASFADVGQGFGFLGLRDANGVRPDATPQTAGLLGAAPMLLPSQQAEGQDIDQREVSEYGTLSWRREFHRRDSALLAVTLLHAGQDVFNHNPLVDLLNLPVDNSIEYNPTVARNIHHTQFVGSVTFPRGSHDLKSGFQDDEQNGAESYQITPASRLALDDLAAVAPNLAPAGAAQLDANGKPVLDVNGNPVYVPTSAFTPTLKVHRTGFYRAAYLQDTWKLSHPFTINYGLRFDWYRQGENLGQQPVDTSMLSPRLNFSYSPDKRTIFRWSYDRLFNTPPLAQGAVVGQPIVPERLSQYDISVQRQVAPGQAVGLAYYYKQIRDQVDTGLLIPGSWVGLYSAVNFEYGAVHGLEFSYDFSPPKGLGWDGFFNYTYSIAAPNGVDSTGAPAPRYNDHDQRNTIGVGLAYLFKGGASAATTINYGSGLASSPITPNGPRIPRTQIDLHLTTGNRFFHRRGGLGLDVTNLLDERKVINFQSGFSGTRFMMGRRVLLSAFWHF